MSELKARKEHHPNDLNDVLAMANGNADENAVVLEASELKACPFGWC